MKINSLKKQTISLLGILISISLYAQIDPKVEVRRDFEGKLMEINKSKLNTSYADSLGVFKLNFDYSIFNKPIKDLYEFSPVKADELKRAGEIRYPFMYAKLGASYPLSTLADIHLQHYWKKGFSINAFANHDAFWGKPPIADTELKIVDGMAHTEIVRNKDVKLPSDRIRNRFGLQGSYTWLKGEVNAGIDYNNNLYVYPGLTELIINSDYFSQIDLNDHSQMREQLSHRFSSVGVDLSVRSTNLSDKAINYLVGFRYSNMRDKESFMDLNTPVLNENKVDFSFMLGKNFDLKQGINLYADYQYVGYTYFGEMSANTFNITPMYSLRLPKFTFNAGVKFSGKKYDKTTELMYEDTDIDKKFAYIIPVASVTYKLWKDYVWIYSKIDGENRYLSHSYLLEQSPYLRPNIHHSYSSVPFRIEAGLNGGIGDKFSYNIYGRYIISRNRPMFYADSPFINEVTTYLRDINYGSFGGELMFKSKSFSAGIEADSKIFDRERQPAHSSAYIPNALPIALPEFEGRLFVGYNHKERISVEMALGYRSRVYTGSINYVWELIGFSYASEIHEVVMPSFIDLRLNVKYVVNNTLSLFLEGSNLLNKNIQYWPNVFEPGLKIGGGIYLTL